MDVKFKNGSTIHSLDTESGSVRGKRLDGIWESPDRDEMSQEEIDAVLKLFITQKRKLRPSETYFYLSSNKLTFWQRVWLDVVLPVIRRITR